MAIADSVLLRTRGLGLRCRINGVLLTGGSDLPAVLSLEYGDAYDTPPYLNLDLNTIPAWIRAGMDVEVDAGINNDIPRQFTGFITALPGEEPEFLRDQIIVDGGTVTQGTPPDDTQVAISATATLTGADIRPPLPAGTHIGARIQNHLIWDGTRAALVAQRVLTDRGRVPGQPAGGIDRQTIECNGPLYNLVRQIEMSAIDAGGLTDQDVIELVLDRVGITNRAIETPPDGWYTLADDAEIDVGTGADQLSDIVGIAGTSGLQFHQTSAGISLLRFADFFPAPTAAFEFSTNDPTTAFITSTEGITELAITYNPTITKGMTGQFTIPHLNVNGRYFVYGVRHVIPLPSESDGPTTYLRLRGGNRLGGTVAVNPIASFTFAIRRQVINDRVYLIYTLDGSGSVALDGTITDWDWTITTGSTPGAITTSPAHPLTGKIVTFIVDPADIDDGILSETLTVTADNGLTHAVTINLPNAATETAVVIAPFGVAAGTRTMVSPNGGETYNDSSESTATAVGARPPDGVHSGHFIFGFSDGRLERTTDFNASGSTQVLAAVGSQFNYIAWDWRASDLVWALTENCKLYLSTDGGATFALFRDFRTVTYVDGTTTSGALGNRIGLPAGGGVYIFGGDGAGLPLIAFMPLLDNVWTKMTFTGDLATDTATPADATMRIVDYTAPGDGMEHMILAWASGGGASLVAIYYTTSPPGPSRAFSRATGLTAGLKTGRVILSDAPLAGPFLRHAMFADRDTWTTTDGIAWTKTANVLPSGYTPNHGLFESDVLTGLIGMQGVYLIAAENSAGDGGIFKSTDGMATLVAIRGAGATYATPTYPTGAKPKQIAIGAAAGTPGSDADIIILTEGGATNTVTKLIHGTNAWTALVNVTGSTQSASRVFPITDQLIFASDDPTNTNTVGGGLFRSTDGGATWAAASPSDGVAVCRAADGRLWCIARTAGSFNQTKIYRDSMDDGATWNLIATIGDGTTQSREGTLIAAHPLNPDIIVVWGPQTDGASGGFVSHTVNGTATSPSFSTNTSNAPSRRQAQAASCLVILDSGRWVLSTYTGTTTLAIVTTDDKGATAWTTRYSLTGSSTHRLMGLAGTSAKMAAMIYNASTGDNDLIVSTDGATTWASAGAQTFEDFAGGARTLEQAIYDPISDAMFVADDNQTSKKVSKLTPCASDGEWSDISFNIPDAQYMSNAASLAVIP